MQESSLHRWEEARMAQYDQQSELATFGQFVSRQSVESRHRTMQTVLAIFLFRYLAAWVTIYSLVARSFLRRKQMFLLFLSRLALPFLYGYRPRYQCNARRWRSGWPKQLGAGSRHWVRVWKYDFSEHRQATAPKTAASANAVVDAGKQFVGPHGGEQQWVFGRAGRERKSASIL